MTHPIGQFSTQQAVPSNASCCSGDKLWRLALRIVSLASFLLAGLMVGSVLAGTLASGYLIPAVGLGLASILLHGKAQEIYDLNDPHELAELRAKVFQMRMSDILEKYPLPTIHRYHIADLNFLKRKCYTELRETVNNPSPVLRNHAEALGNHQIITQPIYRALVNNDVQQLNQLLPPSATAINALFP